LQTGNRGITFIRTLADITWRTHWHVEHAIRPQTDKLPAVMRVAGIAIVDYDGLRRIGQARLDVVVAQNAVDLSHVQGTVVKGDALDAGEATKVSAMTSHTARTIILPPVLTCRARSIPGTDWLDCRMDSP